MMGAIQTGFDFLFAAAIQAPQLRPEAASSIAEGVDHLYFVSHFHHTCFLPSSFFPRFLVFMVKYRRRAENERPPDTGEQPGA
jgi:hypothetical protein